MAYEKSPCALGSIAFLELAIGRCADNFSSCSSIRSAVSLSQAEEHLLLEQRDSGVIASMERRMADSLYDLRTGIEAKPAMISHIVIDPETDPYGGLKCSQGPLNGNETISCRRGHISCLRWISNVSLLEVMEKMSQCSGLRIADE